MTRTWPEDWESRKRGVGCHFCADLTGQSFHSGRVSEALLERHAIAIGHVAVVFRRRHVAAFIELAVRLGAVISGATAASVSSIAPLVLTSPGATARG